MQITATTSATGTDYVSFPAQWVQTGNGALYNDTGTALLVKTSATADPVTVGVGMVFWFRLVASTSELSVKRADGGTTQVVVKAEIGFSGGVSAGSTSADLTLQQVRDRLPDENGRLKVATRPAPIPAVSGDLAALNSVVVCDSSQASNIVFHLKNVGSATMVAGTFVFEASLDSTTGTDGTWFSVQAARSNANTAATSVAITSLAVNAGDTYAWEASVNGYKWFRVRCSVAVTANSVGRWTLQPGTYATEPLPVNQVAAVTTVTANLGTYGGVVYTDSAAALAANATFTGTSRDAGSTVGYGVFYASAFSDQAGTFFIDKSTDATTWRAAAQAAVTANVPVEITAHITTRYVRVRFLNGATLQTAFLLSSTMQRI